MECCVEPQHSNYVTPNSDDLSDNCDATAIASVMKLLARFSIAKRFRVVLRKV